MTPLSEHDQDVIREMATNIAAIKATLDSHVKLCGENTKEIAWLKKWFYLAAGALFAFDFILSLIVVAYPLMKGRADENDIRDSRGGAAVRLHNAAPFGGDNLRTNTSVR